MARAGVWWLVAAILAAVSAAGCQIFRSCEPTSDPDCFGNEMSIVWNGRVCTWVHSAGRGKKCWRSLDECNAEHASCPDMSKFRCGDNWCYRHSQVCGAFADGLRRCVASPTEWPSCDRLGSIATRCTNERRGINIKVAREITCGHLGWRCAAGLEICEIGASRMWPSASCVADTAERRKDCRLMGSSCRSLGDDYRVMALTQDMGTTFSCGGSHTCLRHQEVCVLSAARQNDFTKPGRCVRENFPDCLARGFDHCLADTFGAQYAFR